MKTSTLLMVGLGAACVGFAPGQEPPSGLKPHVTKVLPATSAPVTESEARETFVLTEQAMRKALRMAAAKPAVSIPPGSAPVRRDQVIKEMTRLYDVLRPKIKITPRPEKFDPTVLKMADPKEHANLTMFVRMGAVGRVGPLATGPGNVLTVPQFGDAVGLFLARMAQLTNLPSNRWTPVLEPPSL